MKSFQIVLLTLLIGFFFACGGGGSSNDANNSNSKTTEKAADDGKGVGEITHVELNNPLDPAMVDKGKAIYELKCAACHKLKGQRVVGPSWEGLTTKRKPEWLMNMITNVEVMLAEDETARELLKECLVRMPNQNLTNEDARDVVEFMYSVDGQEVGK